MNAEEISINNFGKIMVLLIFLGLLVTLNAGFAASNATLNKTTNLTTNTTKNYAAGSSGTIINIKVLIYNGNQAAYSCVNGIK
ncbi:MAG TPA: hypothetical protein PKI66_07955, partial [Methanobacteriaceae archaeon]|nr:hypothetical protein [Methanobacteriaceae archaeon]